MNERFAGIFIRRERLKKGWSQAGLCKGVCAVSYLSKIERGKAPASEEILTLLLRRLGVAWHGGGEQAARAAKLAGEWYDALYTMDMPRALALHAAFDAARETLLPTPWMLDFLLLESAFLNEPPREPLEEFSSAMDERQYALWLYYQQDFDRLLALAPTGFFFLHAGRVDYTQGRYMRAIERLRRANDLAAQDGAVQVMLFSRLYAGNCYSDLGQFETMRAHYAAGERIARAVGNGQALADIAYNIASTNLELGQVREAYAYFRTLEAPSVMALHKLAICCERLGRREEALAALARVPDAPCPYPPRDMAHSMCDLVGYRLAHPDYLRRAEYGERLLDCFARMRGELPRGYAQFHARYVREWLKAARQYRQLCELLTNFPEIHA